MPCTSTQVRALAVDGHPVANELGNRAEVSRLDHPDSRTEPAVPCPRGHDDACVPVDSDDLAHGGSAAPHVAAIFPP